jgi:radical SAM-linked protein
MPGVQVKWQDPEVSFLEGVFARGDRRLSRLLVAAYRNGCRFDGWGDQFRFDRWQQAFAATGIDPERYTVRPRALDEPLPWDHIDTGVTRAFLRSEWDAALGAETAGDCRDGGCNRCGVCDFDTLAPVVFGPEAMADTAESAPVPSRDSDFKTLQVDYAKLGPGRFFGHLEMVSIFVRAIRRAGIPVKYSGGFHPMPRISFNDPLPIGMESELERFYLAVPGRVRPVEVPARLNACLPEGLAVLGCRLAPSKAVRRTGDAAARYRIRHPDPVFDAAPLDAFVAATNRILTRTSRKGRQTRIDLKAAVLGIRRRSPHELEMVLKMSPGSIVRPLEVLQAVFDLPEDIGKQAAVRKLAAAPETEPWIKN